MSTTNATGLAAELGVRGLVCKECGEEHSLGNDFSCSICFGALEIDYDYDEIAQRLSRESIASGPFTLWRYAELLPVPTRNRIDTGTGWTPLRAAPRLAAELGLKKVWIKNDAANPTLSFKDRVVSVALTVAKHLGYEVGACASTGNLANSVAAHCAAAGLRSVVFIPRDLEPAKIAASAVYGGEVVGVDGSYDDVNRICSELAGTKPWAFVNVNLRPYYSEGSKTVGYEIAEQLGWRAPSAIVCPVASGSLLTKVQKGLTEFETLGLIEDVPTVFHGAQAEGCSPVARAFADGSEYVDPVRPHTVAKSLAIGNPADGHRVLQTARKTGGRVEAVPEKDVAEGIRLLARTEGLFTETAGGVTISALERLTRAGSIDPEQEVVALVTGQGLKTLDALDAPSPTVDVTRELDQVLEQLERKGL
jgi:threonine synthase